jgi:hypothetical protein
MQTPRILWETPEFTTAAMAVGQSVPTSLNHRVATVVSSQQLPQGPGSLDVGVVHAACLKAGAVHANAADPVGDAGVYDGSDGGGSVNIYQPESPLRHCCNLQQLSHRNVNSPDV